MNEGRVSLPDGRNLAWAELGDPRGRPVLYCLGFPGSRLEPRLADEVAGRLEVRLIGVDRPGIGNSSPAPGRRLRDRLFERGKNRHRRSDMRRRGFPWLLRLD